MSLRPVTKISQLATDLALTGSELLTGIGPDNQNITVQQIADFVLSQIGGFEQLDTPTFSADAISNSEIELTAITYDSDSEAMSIERALNALFTSGLTEIYAGAPKSSHSDAGLADDTEYFYRIQTTATGFIASDYATDSATTEGSGSGDSLIMAGSGDTLIMAGSGDTLIMA